VSWKNVLGILERPGIVCKQESGNRGHCVCVCRWYVADAPLARCHLSMMTVVRTRSVMTAMLCYIILMKQSAVNCHREGRHRVLFRSV